MSPRTNLIALAAGGVALVAVAPATAATTLKLHDTITKTQQTKSGVKLRGDVTDRKTGDSTGTIKVTINFDEKAGTYSGSAKVMLGDGTIRLSFDDTKFSAKSTKGEVEGGTGAYQGASGTFKDVDTSKNEDDLTIKLD